MVFGAVAQSIPDIDVISSLWLGPAENLLAHRGFTHSILFAVLITGLLAFIAKRWYQQRTSLQLWMLLFGINIFVHIFIDAFNAYGTGWFEPFSHQRISFHTLFVIDPLFTIGPFIASVVLLFNAKSHKIRRLWWKAGIGISTLYLVYAFSNRVNAGAEVKHILSKQKIQYQKLLITPTPLNSLLWYAVAGDSTGFYIGYRSVFDSKEELDLLYFPKRESLLTSVQDQESLQHLRHFSRGYYTVEMRHDTLVFNDLRFGQMVGWDHPNEQFVFHYFLQHLKGNQLVIQRGRFAKWDNATIYSLLERIGGN